MRIGNLRNIGTILERTQTSDSGAPEYGTWTAVHENVWAEIKPARGRTAEQLGYEQDRVVASITIRYIDGISNRMRFRHLGDAGTVDYDVDSVMDPDGRRQVLKLICVRAEDTDGA